MIIAAKDEYNMQPNIIYFLSIIFCIIGLILYFNNIWFGVLTRFKPTVVNQELVSLIRNSKPMNKIDLFYINLDKSIDRRNRFLGRLASYWNPVRVHADTPLTMPKITSPLICFTIVDTEYACLASHLKARHMAYHQGLDYVIIAEDDAIIKQDIDWDFLISTAPKDWELLQLHTCCTPPHWNRKSMGMFEDDSTLWVSTDSIIPSAAFYVINRQGMYKNLDRFVKGFEGPWRNVSIDLSSSTVNCHADMTLFTGIKRYICTERFITTESGKSTIHWSHDAFMFGN